MAKKRMQSQPYNKQRVYKGAKSFMRTTKRDRRFSPRKTSDWRDIKFDQTSLISVKRVDQEIVKQMPSSTTTFVERGMLDVFLAGARKALWPGSRDKTE